MTPRRRGPKHTLIVDRWADDDTASVELDGVAGLLVPRALLPTDAGPDAVLRVDRTASRVSIALDERATDAARRESAAVAARLKARDPGGDVAV